MEATITTTRPAPLSRWTAALARARAEGITLYRNDQRDYFALSSDGQRLYPVSLQGCSCKAGQQGNVCKHSAALRAALGLLTDDEPTPEPPAPVVVTEPVCRTCDGDGTIRTYYGDHLSDYVVHTCRCQRQAA